MAMEMETSTPQEATGPSKTMPPPPPAPLRRHASRSRSRSTSHLEAPTSRGAPGGAEEPDLEVELTTEERLQKLHSLLPAETLHRLNRFVEEGLVKEGDFDVEALAALVGIKPELQAQVLDHLDSERIFLTHSRSRSGFLVAACDRAKHGALDPRGMGAPDPWRPYLMAIARPRRPDINLVREDQWLLEQGNGLVKVVVDVSADRQLGVPNVELLLRSSQTCAALKERLRDVGVTVPLHKMRLTEERLGHLRDERSLAFYNLSSGARLQLRLQQRAGTRVALRKAAPAS